MLNLSLRDITGGFIFVFSLIVACVFLFMPNLKDIFVLGVPEKVLHICLFYTLTTIALFSVQKIRKLDILFGMVFFATITEVIQIFTGRNPSVLDWLADFIGISMAIVPLYSRSLKRNNLEKRNTFKII